MSEQSSQVCITQRAPTLTRACHLQRGAAWHRPALRRHSLLLPPPPRPRPPYAPLIAIGRRRYCCAVQATAVASRGPEASRGQQAVAGNPATARWKIFLCRYLIYYRCANAPRPPHLRAPHQRQPHRRTCSACTAARLTDTPARASAILVQTVKNFVPAEKHASLDEMLRRYTNKQLGKQQVRRRRDAVDCARCTRGGMSCHCDGASRATLSKAGRGARVPSAAGRLLRCDQWLARGREARAEASTGAARWYTL